MSPLHSLFLWIYAGTYFWGLLASVYILSWFRDPSDLHAWIQNRILILFKHLGASIQIEYTQTIPQDRPFIFMANHSSLLDIPLLAAVIPQHFVGILANHQFKFFLYGPVLKRLGHLSIERDSVRHSLKVFEAAKALLASGTSITVLPEGGRSMTGQLMPLKRLPFRFAQESRAEIVPISISGVFAMKPKGRWTLQPGPLIVRFGPIVSSERVGRSTAGDLQAEVQTMIRERLEPFERGEIDD